MENNKAFFGLPSYVKFCKKCVISNQRPSSTVEFNSSRNDKKEVINFNKDGICSACVYHDSKSTNINWKERENQLVNLLNKFKSDDGSYDVIVPGSGGKDSAFTSHILKYKYGMNPLTVTWSPHLYTDIGWKNMQNWSHVGGLDNILYTPNGKLHREMTKNAFHNLLHPFQPFIVGQRIIGPAMAKRFGVKLVMYGENQAEYGNPLDDNRDPFMKPDFFSIDNNRKILLGGQSIDKIIRTTNFNYSDFVSYFPPTKDEINNNEIKVSYLGFFEKWDPQECYYYSVENTGFKPARERSIGTYSRYTEIDDKIVPLHFYMTFIKFGIGRATYDASQEIRNKKITRTEGVYLVKKFDNEFPDKYLNDYLDYLSISEKEFFNTINKFRSPHLWARKHSKWMLRHNVAKTGIDD